MWPRCRSHSEGIPRDGEFEMGQGYRMKLRGVGDALMGFHFRFWFLCADVHSVIGPRWQPTGFFGSSCVVLLRPPIRYDDQTRAFWQVGFE